MHIANSSHWLEGMNMAFYILFLWVAEIILEDLKEAISIRD